MKATDLRGPARTLAVVQLISRTGDGAYYVTSALFFTQIVGLSPAQLGLGLTVAWSVALAFGVPLGHVTDRLGARETAIFFYACAALAVGSYVFIRSFPLFLLAATLYAVGQRCSSTRERCTSSRSPLTRVDSWQHHWCC
jgi:nitrate/nitrite transporter NarK